MSKREVWSNGVLMATEDVEAAPEPDPPEVVAAEAIAAEIDTRLAPADVNSIAEVKAAIRDGLAAAVQALRAQ